ncbi:hypothetical protein [Altererythrobacter sp. MTPC7]|uniref:hypothetical protein n=1 Tax=Altererythrobacter sp. MTPC7 TaxID=3056567 RepID=UPI0036F3DEC0
MTIERNGTPAKIAAVCGALLLLTGCFLQPGKFDAELTIEKGGTFGYSYDGEIYLLGLSKLAEIGQKMDQSESEFVEQPCYDDGLEEDAFVERTCTAEEIAAQKRDYEESLEQQAREQERESEMMKAMLGGLDPTDPDAAQELVERLERQVGWNSVEYSGDGLFNVSFAVRGRLSHDFVFPTMERVPMANHFVQLALREDGKVRMDAPGFAVSNSNDPFSTMMGGMTGMFGAMAAAGLDEEDEEDLPLFPELQGTFRLVTDARILANNTDEGPQRVDGREVLTWDINTRTTVAPTALIDYGT